MRHLLPLALAAAALVGSAPAGHADGTLQCSGSERLSRPGDWYLCRDRGYGGTCWHFGIMITPGDPIHYDGC